MLDQNLNWKDAENIKKRWNGIFCLKGIMSREDALKAVDIGADAIMISNHGGRQLDGSRSPFDQLDEIVEAVGGKIDIICDGGIRRGTHILKSLSKGATVRARVEDYTCMLWRQEEKKVLLNRLVT